MTTSALPLTPDLAERLHGSPLLLLLDIDGTLAPIALRPEDAVVPPETQRVLRDLAAVRGVIVAAISGRAAADARNVLGIREAWVVGNHGIEIAPPGEPPIVRGDVGAFAGRMADASRRASELLRDYPGVSVEDKRWTLSVHYRRAAREIVPVVEDVVGQLTASLGLKLTRGKEVFEIRPPLDIHKGSTAVELAQRLGAFEPGASILAAGDDRTDEDMFRALRSHAQTAVTIRVGEAAETAAEFRVADTAGMRELLGGVLALRR